MPFFLQYRAGLLRTQPQPLFLSGFFLEFSSRQFLESSHAFFVVVVVVVVEHVVEAGPWVLHSVEHA